MIKFHNKHTSIYDELNYRYKNIEDYKKQSFKRMIYVETAKTKISVEINFLIKKKLEHIDTPPNPYKNDDNCNQCLRRSYFVVFYLFCCIFLTIIKQNILIKDGCMEDQLSWANYISN